MLNTHFNKSNLIFTKSMICNVTGCSAVYRCALQSVCQKTVAYFLTSGWHACRIHHLGHLGQILLTNIWFHLHLTMLSRLGRGACIARPRGWTSVWKLLDTPYELFTKHVPQLKYVQELFCCLARATSLPVNLLQIQIFWHNAKSLQPSRCRIRLLYFEIITSKNVVNKSYRFY